MREILFRGKRVDNGEWIEGMLFNGKEDTFIIPHGNEYSYDEQEGLAFDVYVCEVDPETVWQYTGLTDMNGKKVFEGDIVVCQASTHSFTGVVKYSNNYVRFIVETIGQEIPYPMDSSFLYVAIGNINDNPELLEDYHEQRT